MSNLRPDVDERLRERLGATRGSRRPSRAEQQRRRRSRRCVVGSAPIARGGTDEMRFLGRRARDAHDVPARRSSTSTTAVEQRERAVQRQREPVERRDHQERDLDGVRAPELDVGGASGSVGRRPRRRALRTCHAAISTTSDQPDADQQLVAAGHVRERVGRVLRRVLARLPREDEVDRVLGQHRDQGEQREREAGRDVELQHLGAHASMNAAPTTASPKTTAASSGSGCRPADPQDEGGGDGRHRAAGSRGRDGPGPRGGRRRRRPSAGAYGRAL